MKISNLILWIALLGSNVFAQDKESAERFVAEGVQYHDKGDYIGAISKYDKTLELDKDNLLALTEKAFSLVALQKFDESIICCKQAIEKHPAEPGLTTVYTTYGNALDGLGKTDQAIDVYSQGIKLFPDYYQLYFNKGVTLSSIQKYDDAILCFQKAVMINPQHASSHNGIARLLNIQSKRIPSLLAYSRFLILETDSKRAKENLEALQKIMKGNTKQTGKNSITINIDHDMIDDSKKKGKVRENNFQMIDFLLAMSAGLDFDDKNKNKTELELFSSKFEIVCTSIIESKKGNYGFYWDYYVPYFTEMYNKKLIETFSYIAFAPSDSPIVTGWLKDHKTEVENFYDWSKSFSWKTK